MDLEISRAAFAEKSILRNLMQLYLYEFSQFDGADVDDFGLFGFRYLDQYWVDQDRYPYLIRVGGQLAGFALLRQGTYFEGQDVPQELGMTVAEFFVLLKYRRRGAGKQAAFQLFDRHPGRWEVAQIPENHPATEFWRKVVTDYTGGDFREYLLDTETWQGSVQVFNNFPAAGK